MAGTILCGVTDTDDGRAAAQMALALSTRLGLRLVLAHAVDGLPHGAGDSFVGRERIAAGGASLAAIATDVGVGDAAELRIGVGDRGDVLARIAAEEGADLIVLGSRPAGLREGRLRCALARELEAATAAPVLIAPPQTRRRATRRLAAAEPPAAR